ncbi:TetR/AcrR family transcriptional regulator [Mycobacterium sp. CBMA271]|uniref:TetR/AcrR family transcriptional regulator n=1 Tax=unclassified Mycobacteroides TaxID=2618759 RepID=UPI0012DE994B|nr:MULTISPECIES: TetR/AcrR family transcriptional regulator [unclassified Mycobacteroides]MUM15480.1 TetR family transcriptional regulator [Mycobacteroides sp. CBMA 326]MUM23569.1 TetR/AcrR family transcriptional regulator [Mycobacteroides sp. CBMA 271]
MAAIEEPVRGRRRSSDIDTKALVAARELLVEQGWEATTMVAIAERAGVGKPALYRRWPSRAHLVFEAVFGWTAPTQEMSAAAGVDDWVRQSCSYTAELFERPDVIAAAPALLSQMRTDPELGQAMWASFGEAGAELLSQVIRAQRPGIGHQEAHDRANATMLMIIGANVLAHQMLPDERAQAVLGYLPELLSGPGDGPETAPSGG